MDGESKKKAQSAASIVSLILFRNGRNVEETARLCTQSHLTEDHASTMHVQDALGKMFSP